MAAARIGSLDGVKLINGHADPNEKDDAGRMALHWA
jgi:hypothetical protein